MLGSKKKKKKKWSGFSKCSSPCKKKKKQFCPCFFRLPGGAQQIVDTSLVTEKRRWASGNVNYWQSIAITPSRGNKVATGRHFILCFGSVDWWSSFKGANRSSLHCLLFVSAPFWHLFSDVTIIKIILAAFLAPLFFDLRSWTNIVTTPIKPILCGLVAHSPVPLYCSVLCRLGVAF